MEHYAIPAREFIYNTHFWTEKILLHCSIALYVLCRKCAGRSWYCQLSVLTNKSGLPCRCVMRSQQYAVRGTICNPDANDYCSLHTERFVKKLCTSLRYSLVLGCASTVNSRSFTSAICRKLVSRLGGRFSIIFLFGFCIHESNLVNEKCSNESCITIRLGKHLGHYLFRMVRNKEKDWNCVGQSRVCSVLMMLIQWAKILLLL